ncbi:hypothetical protein V496_10292 [Pseudogymnoascus sp. VKM F-4515 (FW-2607)]|nr:hypothetical protein V496_10292 [Pseudogymnoascus sp. VKM F-4515 (FW-2607)]
MESMQGLLTFGGMRRVVTRGYGRDDGGRVKGKGEGRCGGVMGYNEGDLTGGMLRTIWAVHGQVYSSTKSAAEHSTALYLVAMMSSHGLRQEEMAGGGNGNRRRRAKMEGKGQD